MKSVRERKSSIVYEPIFMDSRKTGTAEAISKEEIDSDVEKRHRDIAGEEEARADRESSIKTHTCGQV